MRIIKTAQKGPYTVSIYEWNTKYITKFETKYLEQTYKFSTYDYSIDAIEKKINEEDFLLQISEIFKNMAAAYKTID